MSMRRQARQGRFRTPILLVLVCAIAAIVSLGAVLQTYAMPVEAHQTEAWYGYNSNVGFQYVAAVKKGDFYPTPVMQPEDLVQVRMPVEPAVFHRVLLTRYTDSIEVKIPYKYQADRAAVTNATLRIDGSVVVPNVWKKAYPFVQQKSLEVHGTEVSGLESFTVDIAGFVNQITHARDQDNLVLEPMEIHIRPVLNVEVSGLKQPVTVTNSPEFVISVKATTIEIDEPHQSTIDKTLSETKILPITVSMLGNPIEVAVLRQVSTYALAGCLVIAVILVLVRRRRPNNQSLLQRLGTNLIVVQAFEIPGETAVVDLASAKELLKLHAQTERPVLKAGDIHYLLDGTTCYRLVLTGPEATE